MHKLICDLFFSECQTCVDKKTQLQVRRRKLFPVSPVCLLCFLPFSCLFPICLLRISCLSPVCLLHASCLSPACDISLVSLLRSSLEIPEINAMAENPRVSPPRHTVTNLCTLYLCHVMWIRCGFRTTVWWWVQETTTSTSWTWNTASSRCVMCLCVVRACVRWSG